MAAYWRVREWRVDFATFTYEGGMGPESLDLGEALLEQTQPAAFIASEKELVCSVDRIFSYESGSAGLSPFCALLLANEARREGDLVKLAADIRLGTSSANDAWISSVANGGAIGDMTLEFAGNTIVVPMYERDGPLSGVTELNFKISAAEYWPYDPGDSDGPIYDTETGAQLRAF